MANIKLQDISVVERAFANALTTHSQVPGQFFLARFLGFQITYEGETCVVEFDVHEFLTNPGGVLHGGVLATALDISMGHLIWHIENGGATVDLNVQFHRAVATGRICCVASIIHRTHRMWFMRATATAEGVGIVASASGTFILKSA